MGTGYFPVRMLRKHEAAGRLHRVEPECRLTAYLCFSANVESEPLRLALESIRPSCAGTRLTPGRCVALTRWGWHRPLPGSRPRQVVSS